MCVCVKDSTHEEKQMKKNTEKKINKVYNEYIIY